MNINTKNFKFLTEKNDKYLYIWIEVFNVAIIIENNPFNKGFYGITKCYQVGKIHIGFSNKNKRKKYLKFLRENSEKHYGQIVRN